jgi:hypothetical protein
MNPAMVVNFQLHVISSQVPNDARSFYESHDL